MTKTKGIVYFVVSALIIVLLGLLVVNGTPNWKWLGKWKQSGNAGNIKLGLDLEGGVSVTYKVSEDNGKWTEQNLADTRSKLEQRIHDFSNEATAYKEGEDRITVEIPGETDIQSVLDRLGATGELYFCTKLADGANVEVEGHETISLEEGAYVGTYEVWLTGEEVADAQGVMDTNEKTKASEAIVSLKFSEAGREAFANMTTAHNGDQTFIIYDKDVISAPTVQNAITNGEARITGMSDLEEAKALATGIRNGALDLKLERISSKVVSAQLGSDALAKSVKAGIIGILLIILFLLCVYRIPGIAAGFALISYTELIMLVLNAYDITLTLPGIAGIILGIGMAVDANVIIYARIREEIAKGKTVKSAIKLGFEKATSAIVDGNITTFIAALILIWRGSGSVRGFGQTLAIGIVISMFTALVVSRGIVWFLYYMGFDTEKFYGKEEEKKPIDFISKRFICFAVSAACAVAGVAAMGINSGAGKDAFYFSIEFAGGTSTAVEFNSKVDVDKLNKEIVPAIEKELGISGVQSQIDRETGLVTFKTAALDEEKTQKLRDLLVKSYDAKDAEDNFLPEFISGTVSKEMRTNAVLATIVATICMLIYIWFRFKDIRFAGSAVLALIHDVFLVVAFYAISRTLVGTNFIACLLTLVGYSINATIVIFDRIRENKAVMKRTDDIKDIVNMSITQTLTRSIYTSLTTFVMVFMIYIMGVSSIQDFTLPLMVGIIVGGYSSVFLTGSIWYMFVAKKYAAKK
ncbi:MAG: protein translocase subunit SecD [Lachnospiraceae bacterium]|nr:protein translocase subunit SecD [Lachnospiraceae bacterium]